MRGLFLFFILNFVNLLIVQTINASSNQAYQDYLFQYDTYRTINAEFQTARNEYETFQSLSSETAALHTVKTMMNQRAILLRTYIFLLKEKLYENQGLSKNEISSYVATLDSELNFLDSQKNEALSVNSIQGAIDVSKKLENHNIQFQITIDRTRIGLALGNLSVLSRTQDNAVSYAQKFLTDHKYAYPKESYDKISRWTEKIVQSRESFIQSYDVLRQKNNSLNPTDIQTLTDLHNSLLKDIESARSLLIQFSSYLVELKNALKYAD